MIKRLLLILSFVSLYFCAVSAQRAYVDSIYSLYIQAEADSQIWWHALELVVGYINMDIDSALYYAEESLVVAQREGNANREAISLINIGSVRQRIADYDEALEVYFQALDLSRSNNYTRGIAFALNNLSTIYIYKKDYDKALDILHEGLAFGEEIQDSLRIAWTLSNIGFAYFEKFELDSALHYYERTLDLYEELNDEEGIADMYGNIAAVHIDSKQYEIGRDYLERAIELNTKLEDNASLANNYNNMAQIEMELERYDQAIAVQLKGIELAAGLDNKHELRAGYHRLSEIYEKAGNADQALINLKYYLDLDDTITQELHNEQVAEMETKYETQKARNELTAKQLELAKKSNQFNRAIIIAIVLLLVITAIFQYLRNKQRLKRKETEMALEVEKAEASKLKEMDQLKSAFFANISHEFRTPLTLILSPLQQVLGQVEKSRPTEEIGLKSKYLQMMHRNGQRLLTLINQLLDLSKLEGGKMQLRAAKGNLTAFVKAITYSFESLAEPRQIELLVKAPGQSIQAWFDPDKLEKVLVNLLSNAFKFTPEEGRIEVELKLNENGNPPVVFIEVKDSGIGIPPEQLPYIFDRFYSSKSANEELSSTGIGLALTRELVRLHKGEIEVESELDKGTTFKIMLRLGKTHLKEEEIDPTNTVIVPAQKGPSPVPKSLLQNAGLDSSGIQASTKKSLVLVVEDNADVRNYIQEQLEEIHQIVTAVDGEEGLQIAREQIPDLIISDVMMPKIDGKELARQLKNDQNTSHIPLIMLTAMAEREDKLEGLEVGADDYLVKPFDPKELQLRVHNMLEQRRRQQARFQKEVVFKPAEVAVTSVDEAFLQQVLETIEIHLEEEDFSVVDLASSVGMSRSQLHRKLKALSGKSPNQIIRDMRLQRAKELLEKGAGNASEVTYMVGFSSPAYFSKCFKDRFGISPSEV